MREILETLDKQKLLLEHMTTNPLVENYLDIQMNMNEEEWSKYRIFQKDLGGESAIAGVSPTGNFNIYASTKELAEEALKYLDKNMSRPSFILGQAWINDLVQEIYKNSVSKYNPYDYLFKNENFNSFKSDEFSFRKAEAGDLEIVSKWFSDFNENQNANWDLPNADDLKNKNFYLGTNSENELVVACGNTLLNKDRLWIGRLFVYPDHRGKSLGKLMMSFIEGLAKENSQGVSLLVNQSNVVAQKLYRELGYKDLGTNAFWVIESE